MKGLLQATEQVCSRAAEAQGQETGPLPCICVAGREGTTPTCPAGEGGGRPGGAGLTRVPPPLPGSGAGPPSNLHRSNMAPRLCSISAAARRLLGGPGSGPRDVVAVAAAR